MIPSAFDYLAPKSVAEASALLAEHGDDAKVLAGGQSLIPAMRFRLAAPAILVDINGIPDLSGISLNGHLAIGALTRELDLEESPEIARHFPLLADAARVIADPLVRGRATVGGNLAHADPANDHPAVMLAYGAEIHVASSRGSRVIPIDDFFTDMMFTTTLEPDELLTAIHIPRPGPGSGGAYLKVERKVGDYAISAVAVQLTMDGNICKGARIALTNVSPAPMRVPAAEQLLAGQAITDELLEAAGQAAALACDPSSDLRGSAEYKRDLTRVLVKRAVRKAMARIEN